MVSALHPLLVRLDVPVGWSDPDEVGGLDFLIVLVGIPVLLFVVIALASYVPSLVRGEPLRPGPRPLEPAGPELESSEGRRELPGRTGSEDPRGA
jgi:hypothetical protein